MEVQDEASHAPNPRFVELRKIHPEFVYESFHHETIGEDIKVTFSFFLSPATHFYPTLTLVGAGKIRKHGHDWDNLLFHLGLIEAMSYWKVACPPQLVVRAGKLNDEQILWWKDLFLHGLGEFYFRNGIDCTDPSLLEIRCADDAPRFERDDAAVAPPRLILVGGGKDSSLTLELLTQAKSDVTYNAFALNPTRASLESACLVGLTQPITAVRTIDPGLLSLNKKGYLNGHTPFSAYLAFLGTLVGRVYGYSHVITSNERSADEQNVMYKGVPINHQYSKSLRFERMFRSYAATYLVPSVQYWSFLRPLHDLQISAIFSHYARQLSNFRSCNVNQKKDSWCGSCPKCTFVYLSLFPFTPQQKMENIFGGELFHRQTVIDYMRELVGLTLVKPFECVGSVSESRAALILSYEKLKSEKTKIPPDLEKIFLELPRILTQSKSWINELLFDWNDSHFVPQAEALLLRDALDTYKRSF